MAGESTPGNTPAAENTGTPPVGEQTPSQIKQEENITLSKKEHDELQRKAAMTSEAQSRADILEKQFGRKSKRKVEEPQTFETTEISEVKRRVTTEILTNADYQKLTQSNPELARLLTKNPLDLLDTNEFVDVDDAFNQVMDYLDNRVLGSGQPVEPPKKEEPVTSATPSSGANPPGSASAIDVEAKAAEEDAKLSPMERIQRKIARRVNVK